MKSHFEKKLSSRLRVNPKMVRNYIHYKARGAAVEVWEWIKDDHHQSLFDRCLRHHTLP